MWVSNWWLSDLLGWEWVKLFGLKLCVLSSVIVSVLFRVSVVVVFVVGVRLCG